ncbi:MAG: PqqD family protein [Bacteroidales bacterium]|jgi:hypothetical protein|nr:PqqD family protein [Bacteroidales bacterium]
MKIKNGYKIKDIAGERVLIVQGKNTTDMTKVISFNPSAELLWKELAEKEFTLEDVSRLIEEYFHVDERTAATDAQAWITQLADANVIDL